jgi:hypothetical protein
MSSAKTALKKCEDCRWVRRGLVKDLDHDAFWKCGRTNKIEYSTNALTGKVTENSHANYCRVERSYGWLVSRIFFECGKEGRYFEKNELDKVVRKFM